MIGLVDACPILKAYNESHLRNKRIQKQVEINLSDASGISKQFTKHHQDDERVFEINNKMTKFDKIVPDAPKTGTHLQGQRSLTKILSH